MLYKCPTPGNKIKSSVKPHVIAWKVVVLTGAVGPDLSLINLSLNPLIY